MNFNVFPFKAIFYVFLSLALVMGPVSEALAFSVSKDIVAAPIVVDDTSVDVAADFDSAVTSTRELIAEPVIRVGLYKTIQPVMFIGSVDYNFYSGTKLIGFIPANEQVELKYKNGVYIIKSDNLSFSAGEYFRFIPSDSAGYFTLNNYTRKVVGRKANFNVYRGTLEYRYSPRSKMPYIINELPLDNYVAGIAESANDVPEEYAKALLTAARTYAFTHISTNPVTEKRLFDVYATTQDQIYLGYNSEISMPRIATAASNTYGQMVVYNNVPVITPYFGHSSGLTRAWLGADRPWLKSVAAIYDKGKNTWGHGIGMSCNDALTRAKKDGWDYRQILGYYYFGTEVEKIY